MKWVEPFIAPGLDENTHRRVRFMVVLSYVGVAVMLIYSRYWHLLGDSFLRNANLVAALILLGNMIYVYRTHDYMTGIHVGLLIYTLILSLLYWLADEFEMTYLWFFVYPGMSAFLLGARKSIKVNVLMIGVIIFGIPLGEYIVGFTNYPIKFEFNLILVYGTVAFLAYQFQSINESHVRTISEFSRTLETEEAARTKQLDEEVQQKEVLIREVHHRTKNNLSMINSLLGLQKSYQESQTVPEALSTVQRRIQSIAAVHDLVYQSDDVTAVNLSQYVSQLTEKIIETLHGDLGDIELNVQAAPIHVDLQTAIPLGLVVNEMVTNALKYARSEAHNLCLTIDIAHSQEGKVTFTFADNGPGLPDLCLDPDHKSLGMTLIRMLLTDQLGGQLDIDTTNGTRYIAQLPLQTH